MAKRQRRKRRERRREHARREGWQMRHSVITGVGVTAGAVLGFSAPALGATYVVSNTSDPGDGYCDPNPANAGCTLREAITYANADPNTTDRITFAAGLSGTITLGSQLVITGPTYIYGPGPSTLTVSGDNSYRVFDLFMAYTGDPVYISKLTIADGNAGLGGGVFDYNSSLYLTQSVLTGNSASVGGALYENGYANFGRNTYVTLSTLN